MGINKDIKENYEKFSGTVICTKCGKEYPQGVIHFFRHIQEHCTHDAPNESIADYHWSVNWAKKCHADYKERFSKVYSQMNEEERHRHLFLSMRGMLVPAYDGSHVILMGASAVTDLKDFEKEVKESMGILKGLYGQVNEDCNGLCFDEKQEFLSAVRESLIAESQAIVGLLGKAEKLAGKDDLPHVARAHDRLADRARTMVLVSRYLGTRAKKSDKE